MSKKSAKEDTNPASARPGGKRKFLHDVLEDRLQAEAPDPGLPLLAAGHLHHSLRLPGRIKNIGSPPRFDTLQTLSAARIKGTMPCMITESMTACREAQKNDEPSGIFLLDRVLLSLVGRMRIIGRSSLKSCARISDHLTSFKGDFFIRSSALSNAQSTARNERSGLKKSKGREVTEGFFGKV